MSIDGMHLSLVNVTPARYSFQFTDLDAILMYLRVRPTYTIYCFGYNYISEIRIPSYFFIIY